MNELGSDFIDIWAPRRSSPGVVEGERSDFSGKVGSFDQAAYEWNEKVVLTIVVNPVVIKHIPPPLDLRLVTAVEIVKHYWLCDRIQSLAGTAESREGSFILAGAQVNFLGSTDDLLAALSSVAMEAKLAADQVEDVEWKTGQAYRGWHCFDAELTVKEKKRACLLESNP